MGRHKGSKNKKAGKVAVCHPDRPHHAKELCDSCYVLQYRANNPKSKEAHIASNLRWKQKNPDKVRAYSIKSRYGLTEEQHKHILDLQDGRCGICNSTNKLVIDHDHTTMIVRGLLCQSCNLALGLYEKLRSAGDVDAYLDRSFPFVAKQNRQTGKWRVV